MDRAAFNLNYRVFTTDVRRGPFSPLPWLAAGIYWKPILWLGVKNLLNLISRAAVSCLDLFLTRLLLKTGFRMKIYPLEMMFSPWNETQFCCMRNNMFCSLPTILILFPAERFEFWHKDGMVWLGILDGMLRCLHMLPIFFSNFRETLIVQDPRFVVSAFIYGNNFKVSVKSIIEKLWITNC